MLAESWSLKGMTIRVTSFPAIFTEACNGCWSETLEFTPDVRIKTSSAHTPPKSKAMKRTNGTRDRTMLDRAYRLSSSVALLFGGV